MRDGAAAHVSESRGTFDRIRALLEEGAIAPTPSNYDFLYRYVTGADPQLVDAVDVARRNNGALADRTIAHIRRELYGTGRQGVGRILEDTEAQLARMNDYVERQDAGARDYASKLSRSDIDASATLERQRQMLAEMIEATNHMLSTTEQLQAELAASSREIDILKQDLEIARVDARSDALTGLSNRKACCDYLDAQLERARNEGRPLSLIFLDIDHFKKFNDNFGHRMGDEVLRLVSASLERFFHGRGFVARWGGEEFVIVMPMHEAEEASQFAERFRQHIGSRAVKARQSGREVGRVTLSLGVAGLLPEDSAQTLIDRADAALYDAKADGRDRVVCWKAAA
ncbi:diguanylate cyclase [Sphingomonas sp. MAH-6]|nr:diguanylate cyclase [Sphingomonas chungangi]